MSHRFIRPMLACSLVLSLSGCLGSNADRINAALPPGMEFLTAKDKLLAAAKAQAVDAKAIEAELDTRMAQRATGCAGAFKPGLFDDDDAIREKLADKDCFAKADAGLVEWLGLRRVALALDAPPLRPMPKTDTSCTNQPMAAANNSAATPNTRLLPLGARSSFSPPGVSSISHASTTATGSPSNASKVIRRGTQSGKPNCGATVAPTWIASHATTR